MVVSSAWTTGVCFLSRLAAGDRRPGPLTGDHCFSSTYTRTVTVDPRLTANPLGHWIIWHTGFTLLTSTPGRPPSPPDRTCPCHFTLGTRRRTPIHGPGNMSFIHGRLSFVAPLSGFESPTFHGLQSIGVYTGCVFNSTVKHTSSLVPSTLTSASYPPGQVSVAMSFAGPHSVDLMTRVLCGLGPSATPRYASHEDYAPSWEEVFGELPTFVQSSPVLSDVVNTYVHPSTPVTSCLY